MWIYETAWGVALYGFWSGLLESRGHARVLKIAAPQAGESVLELATGTGELFREIAHLGGLKRCVGLDLSSNMLARIRRRLARGANSCAVLCRADARSLPFQDSSFDVIINCYLMDLLAEADIRCALKELERVLKPEGRLVLVVMARQSRVVQGIWTWLYRYWPHLVGGCRPVPIADFLASGAWRVAHSEQITQWGFRSDLMLATRSSSSRRQRHITATTSDSGPIAIRAAGCRPLWDEA